MKNIHFKRNGFQILAIPVLSDNFVYLVYHKHDALLIDVGEAEPVIQALKKGKLHLEQILITHHHYDHVGGWAQMQEIFEDRKATPCGKVEAISTPGHMKEHLSYYLPKANVLFTGDTIINGGCGRLLGGTASQLFESLNKLCELPDDTLIFGGHDYLEDNMRFALSEEPDNTDMQARLELYKTDPAAAIFATLEEEKKTNPFLRAKTLEEFTKLRLRKDEF